jgi:hypothetical protein
MRIQSVRRNRGVREKTQFNEEDDNRYHLCKMMREIKTSDCGFRIE